MLIKITSLIRDNFRADSLDGFIRRQAVTECWRNADGEWTLQPNAFTEDWDLPRLRKEADDILHSSKESQAAYRALGCVHAGEIDPARAAKEPCDVQMEYDLRPALVIRFGEQADLPSWMSLVRRVAWNFPGLETEAALQEHASTVSKFIGKGNAICAVQGGEVVGVLLFSRRLNMLCCMAVAPEFRRHGVAQRMFDLMLTIADPARDLTVTTFREGDPKGDAPRAFYMKNGFAPAEMVVENEYPCQVFIRKGNGA